MACTAHAWSAYAPLSGCTGCTGHQIDCGSWDLLCMTGCTVGVHSGVHRGAQRQPQAAADPPMTDWIPARADLPEPAVFGGHHLPGTLSSTDLPGCHSPRASQEFWCFIHRGPAKTGGRLSAECCRKQGGAPAGICRFASVIRGGGAARILRFCSEKQGLAWHRMRLHA